MPKSTKKGGCHNKLCPKTTKLINNILHTVYLSYIKGDKSPIRNIIKPYQHGGIFNIFENPTANGTTKYDYDNSLSVPYDDVLKYSELNYKNDYIYKPVNKIDEAPYSNFSVL